MRKKRILAILCLVAALAATGCSNDTVDNGQGTTSESGKSNDTAEGGASDGKSNDTSSVEPDTTPITEGDFALADCVKLGEYKGLKLTRSVEAVSEEDVDSYVASQMNVEEVTDAKATVQQGDTVNIAYEGTRDGVAFEGGTSSSYDLVIGSGRFIEGFEDGIIGMKAGESRDLDLTFPENYKTEDLRGAAVVFHVTVNKISRAPELTDEWVLENTDGEYTTAEEFRQFARDNLETNKQNSAMQAMRQDAWRQVEEGTEFLQLPRAYVEEGETEFESGVKQEAAYSGMELDAYIEANGLSQEQYENRKEQYGRAAAKSRLMLDALQEAEGLSTEDEEYQEGLEKLAESYGVDADTLVASYGQNTVEQYIMTSRVLDRLLSYADITDETE